MGPAKTISGAIVLTKTTQINMGCVEMIYCLDLFRIDQTNSKQWRIAAYACTSGVIFHLGDSNFPLCYNSVHFGEQIIDQNQL